MKAIDPLSVYIKSFIDFLPKNANGKTRLLSREEEIELGKIIQSIPKNTENKTFLETRQNARNKLVEANLRLPVNIAKKYRDKGLSIQELIQEGNDGLIKAAEEFIPDFNNKFSTFAVTCIKNSICSALRKQMRLNKTPTFTDIKQFGTVQEKRSLGKKRDYRFPEPAMVADYHLLKEDINKLLKTIPPDYAEIIRMYFERDMTVREIAHEKGYSHGNAHQLLQRAFIKVMARRQILEPYKNNTNSSIACA